MRWGRRDGNHHHVARASGRAGADQSQRAPRPHPGIFLSFPPPTPQGLLPSARRRRTPKRPATGVIPSGLSAAAAAASIMESDGRRWPAGGIDSVRSALPGVCVGSAAARRARARSRGFPVLSLRPRGRAGAHVGSRGGGGAGSEPGASQPEPPHGREDSRARHVGGGRSLSAARLFASRRRRGVPAG